MFAKLNVHSQIELVARLTAGDLRVGRREDTIDFLAGLGESHEQLGALLGFLEDEFTYKEPFAGIEILGKAAFARYLGGCEAQERIVTESSVLFEHSLVNETGSVTAWRCVLERSGGRRAEYLGMTMSRLGAVGLREMVIYADLRPLEAIGLSCIAEALRLQYSSARAGLVRSGGSGREARFDGPLDRLRDEGVLVDV